MSPHIEHLAEGKVILHPDDCLEAMPLLDANFIDSCVTDPPYGLGFMGKHWDHGVPGIKYWREVFRVLKPGAHLLSFGGTRTYHRMVCAIEDAGFEIRDSLQWLYGSGFPKSHDVSKGIDRVHPRIGMFDKFAEHYEQQRKARELTHAKVCAAGPFFDNVNHGGASVNWGKGHNVPTLEQWKILQPLLDLSIEWLPLIERVEAERKITGQKFGTLLAVAPGQDNDRSAASLDITAPAADEAREWQGWGTALKPATEIICLARKPLSESTVAANVLKWGTGALNIDGCRVDLVGIQEHWANYKPSGKIGFGGGEGERTGDAYNSKGRWPANVIHDGSDEVVGEFPESVSGSGAKNAGSDWYAGGAWKPQDTISTGGDSGSASRFFYTAKADSDDRLGSKHPTVKPLDLMQYLVRLVTKPGGLVLDPFAGTGTTGEAAFREGCKAILIEREEEYQEDIRRRMALVMSGPEERSRESIKAKTKDKPVDHGPLFGPAPAKQEVLGI